MSEELQCCIKEYLCTCIYIQVASSTLDASAKIYAGRVDSIYNDAFKVLGGLGREGSAAGNNEALSCKTLSTLY